MKKYWKVIVLAVLILATFGTFYIQDVIADKMQIELGLEAEVDTEEIHEDIVIYGDYSESGMDHGGYYNYHNRDSFKLTSETIRYVSDMGYFERMNDGFYSQAKFNQLKEDYKGFIRGKEYLDLFSENETELAYVGPFSQHQMDKKFYFDVEILNKETGDKQSFTVDLKKDQQIEFLSTNGVELVGDEVHVFAYKQYQGKNTLVVYKLDRNSETIVAEETIFEGDELVEYAILNDSYQIMENPYYVIRKMESEWTTEGDYTEVVSSELYAYHVETGELELIRDFEDPIVGELAPYEEESVIQESMLIHDELVYTTAFEDDTLTIEKYNLATGEESSSSMMFDTELIEGLDGIFTLENERLAFISTSKGNGLRTRALYIVDIATEEVIYQGEINIKAAAKDLHVYDIGFYRIDIE